jgi:plasmid maintenance system killer protein
MWHIFEHKKLVKTISKLPPQVIKKYELWKDIIYRHGPEKLSEFPGFNHEKLHGEREGRFSSRLNIKYRVIYRIEREIVSVYIIEITPHEY